MLRLLVVMTVVTVALGSGHTPSCIYWCNFPKAVNAGASYCCINSNHNIVENTNEPHPGRCVAHTFCARSKVPGQQDYPLAPVRCGHDDYCPYHEKCCYDACLKHHTCKGVISH
uniref:Putative crustin-like antimicrobial peptide n=1 Tax=Nephrops norvegicus TaxID=6829 RepID=G8BLI7_NEPNO|nr:putative crustin-like antimicrobial peptide [Nephrops norvegicus]